ncbi:hypothetical protein B0H14DRAFT_3558747 [Mycena olivaceomarginata]|nr:hypothetical protein B0H14DRAFT_3558747 [Mycena olivaceomarginata]
MGGLRNLECYWDVGCHPCALRDLGSHGVPRKMLRISYLCAASHLNHMTLRRPGTRPETFEADQDFSDRGAVDVCRSVKDETRRNEMLLYLFLLCVMGTSGGAGAGGDCDDVSERGCGGHRPRCCEGAGGGHGAGACCGGGDGRREPGAGAQTDWSDGVILLQNAGSGIMLAEMLCDSAGVLPKAQIPALVVRRRRGEERTQNDGDETRQGKRELVRIGYLFPLSRRKSEARSEDREGMKDDGWTGRESRALGVGVGHGEMRMRAAVCGGGARSVSALVAWLQWWSLWRRGCIPLPSPNRCRKDHWQAYFSRGARRAVSSPWLGGRVRRVTARASRTRRIWARIERHVVELVLAKGAIGRHHGPDE